MQIASTCKTQPCDKCDVLKENEPPEKCQQSRCSTSTRHRVPEPRPPSKPRVQRPVGDHTYAVAVDRPKARTRVVKDEDKATENGPITRRRCRTARSESEPEDIGIKSTWLRNLCLEYQPAADSAPDRRPCFALAGCNGALKQYQRNHKVSKSKTELSTLLSKSKLVKSVQEDKKRWIAALALIELAQSK